jgi:hypothetical protein
MVSMWISTIVNYFTLLVILRCPFNAIPFGIAKIELVF